MKFKIGDCEIGDGCRPFFIAEMSANHNQSLDVALEIVKKAAENGANAIKLQTFTPETLTLDSHRPEFFIRDEQSIWNAMRLWDLYKTACTPWQWHEPIFKKARSLGLACISTAFEIKSVEFLASLNADAIKIASFEIIHWPLIRAAASLGRPIIISTGMATLAEIEEAVSLVHAAGNSQLVLLKCTSAYPAQPVDANLATMADLKDRFNCVVGVSDHTLSVGVVAAAVALGASVIEKHFTLSRAAGGVDASFSLEPAEFKAMAGCASDAFSAVGAAKYGPSPAESASFRERPSIYAVAGIRKGEPFSAMNVRIIRPGGGLLPKHYADLLHEQASIDIDAGTPIVKSLIAGDGIWND